MNFDKYKNELEYPTKPKSICDCGAKYKLGNSYCRHCGRYLIDIIKEREKLYRKMLKKYRAEDNRIYEKFKKDALEEVGLTNHRNADKIFNYAWSRDHSSGFYEVYYTLKEISELFEEEN